jgi:hypothetical protein
MTTTTALTIAALVILTALVLFVRARIRAAEGDQQTRQARLDQLLSPYQGARLCTVCGKPTHTCMNDRKRTPVHPGCRTDLS